MTLVLFLCTVISFSSCDDDKCPCKGDCHGTQCSAPCADDCMCTLERNKIVGKWKSTWDNGYAILTFKEDGSGTLIDGSGNNVNNATFYYKYDEDTYLLTLMVSGIEPHRILLEWINDNTFYVSEPGLVDEDIETVWKRQ